MAGGVIFMKYVQRLLYNKGLLTLEKTFLDLYPICSNSIPPNIVPAAPSLEPMDGQADVPKGPR